MWPAISSRRPMIWVFRSSASDCSTVKAIFARRSIATATQRALYPFNDPDSSRSGRCAMRMATGCGLCIPFPGCDLWIRTWEVQVGRTKLYLLDTQRSRELPRISRYHQRTLRRRPGPAHATGNRTRHRRMASSSIAGDSSGSVPSERRPRRFRGTGASRQLHG